MKTLWLTDILVPIKGHIIRGKENIKIINAVYDPENIPKNTLYFHFNGVNLKNYRFHSSVVCVTDNPSHVMKAIHNKVTVVKVKDVEEAYWSFVRFYRGLFRIPVIGVTGTCGKTTTIEMIKTILSHKYRHVQSTIDGKNRLSLNLPYLLNIDEKTEAAVYELGVSHPRCIEYSCNYFQPQVGVLLNIGVYHLLGCKTFENYIKAKAEIIDGIASNGTLILNADDEIINKLEIHHFKGQILYFGFSRSAHYRAEHIRYTSEGMEFILHVANKNYLVHVPGYGEHNVYNALAAIAAVHAIGIDPEESTEWIADFQPVRKHLQFIPGMAGCTVIDDTWNCTPPSVKAALKVLRDMSYGRKTVAVLGYMPQLGKNGIDEYEKVGEKVAEIGIDILILIGKETKRIGIKALEMGMDKKQIYLCHSAREVYYTLRSVINQETLVLLKFPYKYRLSYYPSFRKLMKLILKK